MTPLPALLDLVLPRRCVGCGGVGASFCPTCLPLGALVQWPAAGLPTVAAGTYEGALRAALLRYKERGRRDLAAPLATLLGQSVAVLVDADHRDTATAGRAPPQGVVLVPVPSRRSAVAARGGDHLLPLARDAGRRCHVPVERALRLTRDTADSAGLDAAERFANSVGSMAARRLGAARAAIVVDDIVTTGATLGAAYRALTDAGWQVIGAAVVAATPRLRSRRHLGSTTTAEMAPGGWTEPLGDVTIPGAV